MTQDERDDLLVATARALLRHMEQSGIGVGTYDLPALQDAHRELRREIEKYPIVVAR